MTNDRDLERDVADELEWDAGIDSHDLVVKATGGIVKV